MKRDEDFEAKIRASAAKAIANVEGRGEPEPEPRDGMPRGYFIWETDGPVFVGPLAPYGWFSVPRNCRSNAECIAIARRHAAIVRGETR